MSDKINKSSLKEAKEQFEEIQKFAIDEATKNLKEDVSKKVVELMNNTLDNEEEIVQEEVVIHADSTTVTIDDNGDVEVDAESIEAVEPVEDEVEAVEDEEIVVDDSEDEIEIDNSEIEEMEYIEEMNFEEQEAAAPAPAPAPAPEAAPAAEEMPAEEMPAEEMPVEEMPAEEEVNPLIQPVMDELAKLMSMMGGDAAAGGEEIEIIDDAGEMAPEATPAPESAPVAEEITFEVVNDMQVPEMEDEVLEIVGEDVMEEDTVDENTMSGQGHAVRRAAGNQDDAHGKTSPEVASKRKRMNESDEIADENTAQYEAKIAELIKENESLKSEKDELEQELIKFENGFIKLQENFGEMQDYNAKLVMAYKVAMSGGLTTDEKIQISEQFDKCETVKDAENLYKSIVNEHKIKVNKNPEKSIKSNSIKNVAAAKSTSQPLYESKEVARMKKLAGIKNLNE